MFNNLKRLHKMSKSQRIKLAQDFEYTEDDYAIIDVGVNEYKDIISPFCIRQYMIVNSDFADFLLENVKQLPPSDDVEIHIHSEKEFTKEQQENIVNAIRTHFAERIVTTKTTQRRSIVKSLIMALLGVVVFAGLIVIDMHQVMESIREIISVLGWVFVWDAFEGLLMDNGSLISEQINNFRLMKASVVFCQYQSPKEILYEEEQIGEDEELTLESEVLIDK